MIYVGIDVAKTTHYAAVMDSDGIVLVEPFAFDNDAPGFSKFISKIASFSKEQIIIGLESTGIYSENLICFLFDSDELYELFSNFHKVNKEDTIDFIFHSLIIKINARCFNNNYPFFLKEIINIDKTLNMKYITTDTFNE